MKNRTYVLGELNSMSKKIRLNWGLKCFFNPVVFELALERGKKRGWYPQEWNVEDYCSYLFNN
jgi:hypothetical protein